MTHTIERPPRAVRTPSVTTALAFVLSLSLLTGLLTIQPASAAPAVYGDIGAKYAEDGIAELIGEPVDEEHDAFDGGRTQTFEYGIISWHPTIGAAVVYGQIMTEWEEMGREEFGYPTTDELGTPDGVGRFNHFQVPGGEERSIYWTPETGAQAIFGDFRSEWAADGWERGSLGYPVSREFQEWDATSGVRQNFQHGFLTFDGSGTTFHAAETPSEETHEIVVLRCKFADSDAEPYSDQYYREFFGTAGHGKGGFAEYLLDQTYGRAGVEATIRGWYQMPTTVADARPQDRGVRYDECVDAAADAGYRAPEGAVVVAAVNEQIDGWGSDGAVYLDATGVFPTFAFHEILHGLGRGKHSFSNDRAYLNVDWAQRGEYDDEWDIMSAQHIYDFHNPYFGPGGVGMNASNRSEFNGFDDGEGTIAIPPPGGSADFTIESLEVGGTPLPRNLIVVDGKRFFSVEFRRRIGFSQGIPADTVLIHEIIGDKDSGEDESMVLRDTGDPDRPGLQWYAGTEVRIDVVGFSGDTATIRVTSLV